jgi:hypothetical protein
MCACEREGERERGEKRIHVEKAFNLLEKDVIKWRIRERKEIEEKLNNGIS